jgi:hypothetical protein
MATAGLIFNPAKEAGMAGTKKTAKRGGKVTTPVNARRVGAKGLATVIMTRGEAFGRDLLTHWEGMRAKAAKTTQAEPRTQH